MAVNSPLGKYSQIVAAITAVGVIGAYVIGLLLGLAGAEQLKEPAFLALGAVFTAAAVVNGYKQQQVAIQKRLDEAGIPTANVDPTHQ